MYKGLRDSHKLTNVAIQFYSCVFIVYHIRWLSLFSLMTVNLNIYYTPVYNVGFDCVRKTYNMVLVLYALDEKSIQPH